MRIFVRVWNLWKNLSNRSHVESEISGELEAYVEMLADRKVASGLSPAQARREALMEIGGIEQVREQIREAKAGFLLDCLWKEVRVGVRSLGRNRGATLVAIASLAVGIGLNTAIFTAVNAVLLRPLPYREPERLVMIAQTLRSFRSGRDPAGVAPANFLDWKAFNHSFEDMAIYDRINFRHVVGTPDGATIVRNGYGVSANFFRVLGAEPALGRTFLSGEDEPDAAVVVISHSLWQRDLASDANVIGKTLIVDGERRTIIGLMKPEFRYYMHPGMPADTPDVEFFLPNAFANTSPTNRHYYLNSVIARLKPGVTLQAARVEMNTIATQLANAYPADNRDSGVYIAPIDFELPATRSSLWIAWGTMAILLLICCANVSSLILVRTEARRHEMAIRLAIGASRGRLMRQLLTETLLLGISGGGIGLAFAWAGSKMIATVLPGAEQIRRLGTTMIDADALTFTLLLSIVASLVCGLAPALRGSRTRQLAAIHESRRTASDSRAGTRLRSVLVAVQVALSMVLLACAGLMVRSVWNLHLLTLGFEPERVLTVRMQLPVRPPYAAPVGVKEIEPGMSAVTKHWTITPRGLDFPQRSIERLLQVPGVSAAAVSSGVPMVRSVAAQFQIAGRRLPSPEEQRQMDGWLWYVTPGYFETLQLPLRQGRDFGELDNPTSPRVAVVNEFTAKRWWPDHARIIGEQIRIGKPPQSYEIVGVVGDVRAWPRQEVGPQLYVPISQNLEPSFPDRLMAMRLEHHFVIRTSVDPNSTAANIRAAMHGIENDVPLEQVESMTEAVGRQFRPWHSTLLLLAMVGGLSLLLVAVGIYAVLAYATRRRTNEIGIRVALGAGEKQITWLVIRSGLVLILIGALAGTAAALGVTRFLSSQLFGVTPMDTAALLGALVALIAVGLAACYLPVRRALRIDPALALRQD